MPKKQPPPELITLAEEFVRSVTDRWAQEGTQVTSEEQVKALALKVAKATYIPGVTEPPYGTVC